MKEHMLTHVRGEAAVMFKAATDGLRDSLQDMCRDVEAIMGKGTDAIFTEIRKDYMNVIAGVKLPEGYVMPEPERLMRDEVARKLKSAETLFMTDLTEEAQVENDGNDECDGSNSDHGFATTEVTKNLRDGPVENASESYASPANDNGVASSANKHGNAEYAATEAVQEDEPMLDVYADSMP
jgi:hypothetical protein